MATPETRGKEGREKERLVRTESVADPRCQLAILFSSHAASRYEKGHTYHRGLRLF
jgi:hypothetical protein